MDKNMGLCRICGENLQPLFKQLVLNQYWVSYARCDRCEALQTEDPYWLNEAYEKQGISALDTGIVQRNLRMAAQTARLIDQWLPQAERFLDFGGGTGLFVRLMRDRGFAFYRCDRYTENLFAHGFDLSDLPETAQFDLITSFEVLEHLVNPLETLGSLLQKGNTILFSTDLQPAVEQLSTWPYLFPLSGQHITFYTPKTLEFMAEQLHCKVCTNGRDLHVLTRQNFSQRRLRSLLTKPLWQRGLNWLGHRLRTRPSLVDQDLRAVVKGLERGA